ncbi:Metal-dependent membrane protease, CAAX family [Halalkaliarchaeum sp. AArc-CO]|uniref:CPBP family intramembrane glutamic endopeptidase n=1 Tax=Halalkaliarchaeum sp. AArc-CO TaxID=2866381 RepID=UPI00217E5598|nr:CPBP family intramembrane glutamic endopeptidase [Halalkaliarchaeum sp. AArc-CO]UWG51306.1 Metal-dependent membrane protease, CAAX family [Halalkaliarchaeum sp. AArc-CO]
MSVRSIRATVTSFIWNYDRTRVRAPWRILVPLLPVIAIGFSIGPVFFDAVAVPVAMLLLQFSIAVATLVFVAASTRYLDHNRVIWDYGLRINHRWVSDLLAGFVIGLAGATVPFLLGIYAGWFEVVDVLDSGAVALWSGLLILVLANLCVGFSEELLFRGVLLSNSIEGLRDRFPTQWAIVGGLLVMSVVFGSLHIGPQPIEHPFYLLTWVGVGVLFGVLYLLSGDLALPIGIHASFNIVHSGVMVRTSLPGELSAIARVEPTIQSPIVEYGGGIEAGGVLIVGLLAILWLLYFRDVEILHSI